MAAVYAHAMLGRMRLRASTHMQMNRRDLLKASISLTMLSAIPRPLRALGQKTLAYVGTYSSPVDGGGNGKGIYLFEMNPASGELTLVELAAASPNAS